MFSKTAILKIPLNVEPIYNFLRFSHESKIYKDASLMVKGYVPNIKCTKEVKNNKLAFEVPGRDPILKIFIGGWKWEYIFSPISDTETEVQITYKYGLFMALLGMGTIGHQAANEIVETATALDALSMKIL